jgi:hypothetical protein
MGDESVLPQSGLCFANDKDCTKHLSKRGDGHRHDLGNINDLANSIAESIFTISQRLRKVSNKVKYRKSNRAPLVVDEGADVFDALEALRNGAMRPFRWYLEDASKILSRVADLLDPPNSTENGTRLHFPSSGNVDVQPDKGVTSSAQGSDEWVGSCAEIEAAIAGRRAKPLGWYFRDLGDLLSRLGSALSPPEHSKDWRLQFVRKGRGRRSDPVQQMLADADFALKLRMKTRAAGKQEAAIKDFEQNGVSRATAFRRKQRAKSPR